MSYAQAIPVLNSMKKTRETPYLKNYTLYYTDQSGRQMTYEIVSNFDHKNAGEIGRKSAGVAVIGYKGDKILLCKEFRMGVNHFIYNLPAGHMEEGETVEECARRELYEETGLEITEFLDILPPAYASPDVSDSATWVAMVKVDGEFSDHTEDNEWIQPGLYGREEVLGMLMAESFSGRAQIAARFFAKGIA